MMSEMMEKFMGSMTAEERKGMMQSMIPKMMAGMMGGGGSGIMNMMSKMMGGKKTDDLESLSAHFKLSAASITYFLTRLANKGKIHLKAEKADNR